MQGGMGSNLMALAHPSLGRCRSVSKQQHHCFLLLTGRGQLGHVKGQRGRGFKQVLTLFHFETPNVTQSTVAGNMRLLPFSILLVWLFCTS